MGSWEVDLTTGHIEWDDGPYRIFGVDPAHFEPTVERIEAMIHPDDREKSSRWPTSSARAGRASRSNSAIVRPSGEVRWCYGAGIISRDAAGKAVRMNGVTVDITERKRAEERQVLLAREVDHRAKNTLAVVLSVLRLTRAPTTEAFITTVEGRVHALAATHNLLSSTRWEGADLGKIVEEEMAPYHASHRQRVITSGPAVVLLPATAQAVALALHELATNAAKYGALSTETGTLSVTWRVGGEALVLDWTETGGPPTAEPARLGFGLTIVRSSIEAQFRGGVSYEWRNEGLRCTLSIPAAQIAAARRRPPKRRRRRRPTIDERRSLDRHAPARGRGRAAGQHAGRGDPGRARRHRGRSLRAAGRRRWPRPRPSASTAPFSISTSPASSADPLADLLLARGVPFVFITGYQRESIDRRYANVPVLQKPIDAAALERRAAHALGQRADAARRRRQLTSASARFRRRNKSTLRRFRAAKSDIVLPPSRVRCVDIAHEETDDGSRYSTIAAWPDRATDPACPGLASQFE